MQQEKKTESPEFCSYLKLNIHVDRLHLRPLLASMQWAICYQNSYSMHIFGV